MTKRIAPDFNLPDQQGHLHQLTKYRGKWVVLYFYPKDDTPGCTKEACGFRDAFNQLLKFNTVVFGVSKDSPASHLKFASKYNLNFPLLSDPDHQTISDYGAWGEKKFMGRTYLGIIRLSCLINPHGEIVKVYSKVNPLTHADEILQDLKNLAA